MRWLTAVVLIVAACTGGQDPSDTPDAGLGRVARDFAVTTDRALAGTRFEGMPSGELADAIVAICSSADDFDTAVFDAVAGLPAPAGDPEDDVVAVEVLVAGVVHVCPQRVGR